MGNRNVAIGPSQCNQDVLAEDASAEANADTPLTALSPMLSGLC